MPTTSRLFSTLRYQERGDNKNAAARQENPIRLETVQIRNDSNPMPDPFGSVGRNLGGADGAHGLCPPASPIRPARFALSAISDF
jgi:hypothetical protein